MLSSLCVTSFIFTLSQGHRRSLGPAGIHLLVSGLLAVGLSLLVFCVWYPKPYASLLMVDGIFLMMMGIDVVLGPVLTLVVFDRRKPASELTRDLCLIVLLQVAGLSYGLYVLALGRPVHLVYEVDRFRVVTAADVERLELPLAPVELRTLPWTGPTLIAARPAQGAETLGAVELALKGIDLGMRPSRWVPFGDEWRAEALRRALSLHGLRERQQGEALKRWDDAVAYASKKSGVPVDQLKLLPIVSRFATWSAFINAHGQPVEFVEVDPF